jgi:uncharacterized protein (DUF1778 family)
MRRRRPTHFIAVAEPPEQAEIIRLSLKGQRQIADAILNPPAPNKALKKAARRYRDLFGEGS